MTARLQPGTYQLDGAAGWVRLNTFKEGLLSRMGHDLTLEIGRFSLQCNVAEGEGPHEVTAAFERDSFQVIGPSTLSGKDKADIHKNIVKHLPGDPSFRGTFSLEGSGGRLEGEVKIAAGYAPVRLSLPLEMTDGHVKGEIELSHRALQIKPFRAPLGVIRLQDRVVLSFSIALTSALEGAEA